MADSAVVDSQQDSTSTDEDTIIKELLGTSVASDVPIQCELLCFVVNKIQTMPYEFISKLCTDFYNEEAVETAKDILFETAFTANADKKPRKIRRRGAGKKQNDLHDILNVCLEMSEAPCYVAKDLANLPPLSMNNFDMSKIIRDIETIKVQMGILTEAQEANLTANVALAGERLDDCHPVTNQVAATTKPDIHTQSDTVIHTPDDCSVNNESDVGVIGRWDQEGSTGEPESDDNDLIRLAAVQKPSRSYADALRHRSRQSAGNTRRSHTQHSTQRNPRPASSKQRQGADAITGTGSFGAFKSAGRGLEGAKKRKRRSCTGIFVTRLARNTQPRDVIRHIEQETGIRCQCEPIQTKYDSYTSFCIRLNPSLHRRLLNPTVWPTGTLVREFLEST